MTYRTSRDLEDKLRLIISIVIPLVMLFLASQGERDAFENKLSYDEGRRIFEESNSRRAEQIRKRAKARSKSVVPKGPRGMPLDDGIQGGKSIKELMRGYQGFL